MGGIVWSKPSLRHLYIDGLEFSSNIERDFEPTEASDKLEQLLRATATSYRPSVIGPALVSAFYLGAFAEQLTLLYEKWVDEIGTPWPEENPVAASIGKDDIPEHFSDNEYELRYYDYFRDCLTESRNWNKVVKEHIDVVWVRLFRDDFRPLITLASAVEMNIMSCRKLIYCYYYFVQKYFGKSFKLIFELKSELLEYHPGASIRNNTPIISE